MACSQCGSFGVDGICSMCYGDIDHNTDGFYRAEMERQWLEEDQKRQEEEAAWEHFMQIEYETEMYADDTDLPWIEYKLLRAGMAWAEKRLQELKASGDIPF